MRQSLQLTNGQPRQLVLTASPHLAAALKRHCASLKATLNIFMRGPQAKATSGATNQEPRADATNQVMLDDYGVRQELAGLPSKFDALDDTQFPLVLSFDMLLDLMDAQLQDPFHTALPSSQRASPGAAKSTIKEGRVDMARFVAIYWPHMNETYKRKAGSAALVWSEVSSTIKGSVDAVKSAQGRLSQSEYVELGSERSGGSLDKEQRAAIFTLYLQYEKLKGKAGEWDLADVVVHVSRGWAASGGAKLLPRSKHIDFVYVDEVQDCCMGLLHLLG